MVKREDWFKGVVPEKDGEAWLRDEVRWQRTEDAFDKIIKKLRARWGLTDGRDDDTR